MYERHIVLPPSGQGPGVLQTKDKTLKPKNQGHNTITTSIEKHRTRYSIVLSKDKPHKLSCLLRCADKHIACVKTKDKGQKPNPKTLRASQLFTVCDTSALACWQYTHLKQVYVYFLKHICLLRCAKKHSVSALKTKDKSVKAKGLDARTLRVLEAISFVITSAKPLKALCLLCCANKHKRIEFKSSKPKSKRQNPVEAKCRGKKASVVPSIRCGYGHHERHACYATQRNTKLLILLFY